MKCLTKRVLFFVCCLLLLFCVSCTEGDTVVLSFYKIGKADAALIMGTDTDSSPFSVLIDTGEAEDAPEIIAKLQAAGVKALDILVLTHFDKDHIGGFPALIDQIPAKQILLPDYIGEGEPYDALTAALAVLTDVTVLTEDVAFSYGDAAFSVSVPKQTAYEKKQDNNASLCVTLHFGKHTVLFAGDAERERQEELIAAGLAPVTLLKVPHHGVWNKGLDVFLKACHPAYAVITDSDKNPAEQETLDALTDLGVDIYETRNGDIRVTLTETDMTVTQ